MEDRTPDFNNLHPAVIKASIFPELPFKDLQSLSGVDQRMKKLTGEYHRNQRSRLFPDGETLTLNDRVLYWLIVQFKQMSLGLKLKTYMSFGQRLNAIFKRECSADIMDNLKDKLSADVLAGEDIPFGIMLGKFPNDLKDHVTNFIESVKTKYNIELKSFSTNDSETGVFITLGELEKCFGIEKIAAYFLYENLHASSKIKHNIILSMARKQLKDHKHAAYIIPTKPSLLSSIFASPDDKVKPLWIDSVSPDTMTGKPLCLFLTNNTYRSSTTNEICHLLHDICHRSVEKRSIHSNRNGFSEFYMGFDIRLDLIEYVCNFLLNPDLVTSTIEVLKQYPDVKDLSSLTELFGSSSDNAALSLTYK